MASMESAHKIKSGKLLSFSEQQLVDCVTTSHGCSGGNVGGALNYLMTNAAMSEASYPYTANMVHQYFMGNSTPSLAFEITCLLEHKLGDIRRPQSLNRVIIQVACYSRELLRGIRYKK